MKRLALNAIVIASLVLTLALAALWVRSHTVLDPLRLAIRSGKSFAALHCTSDVGRLDFSFLTLAAAPAEVRPSYYAENGKRHYGITIFWSYGPDEPVTVDFRDSSPTFSRTVADRYPVIFDDDTIVNHPRSRDVEAPLHVPASFRLGGAKYGRIDSSFPLHHSMDMMNIAMIHVRWRVFRLPHWMPLALTALPFTAWTLFTMHSAIRRRTCQARRICHLCGYDLRATPTRCPECGRAPATSATTTTTA